jgi:hypothetical protein
VEEQNICKYIKYIYVEIEKKKRKKERGRKERLN